MFSIFMPPYYLRAYVKLDFPMNGTGAKSKIPLQVLQVEHLQGIYFDIIERGDVLALKEFIAKNIITNKVGLDARNETGETPLIVSARLGHRDVVETLIHHGADVDAKDLELWSPLLNAAKNGFVEIARLLIEAEADLEQCDVGGWSPLFWAVYKNRLPVVELLAEAKAELDVTDEYGMAPLHWAAGRGYSAILNVMINSGAKTDVRDRFGNNALFWACKKGCLEGAISLMDSGCPIDVVGVNGMTPLIAAVKGRHGDIVERLLEKSANVNTVDQDGLTALAHSCQSGDDKITEMLLAYGSYVNIADRKKESVLMKAVKSGQSEVVKMLLAKYADVDSQDEDGRTALHISIDKGFVDILALLVGHKPNTELRNKDGDTPLLKATKCRNLMAVQLLVQSGSKVSAADKRGDTSLHIALRSRSRRLTQVLLSRPQDSRLLYQPNKAGETPYSIDRARGQPILPHIFGPAESQVHTEAMLGYDIYSNILADVLCEPLLCLPLSVGLYAKWGSGKSFLLNKLRESLGLFSRSWMEAREVKWCWVAVSCIFAACALISVAVFGLVSPLWSVGVFLVLLVFTTILYGCVLFGQSSHWRRIRHLLAPYLISFELLVQILFYHPPHPSEKDLISRPVGFIFADYHRLSSIGGVHALANIVEKLYFELERSFGWLTVRLCSAYAAPYTSKQEGELRRFCGLPVLAMFTVVFLFGIASLLLCIVYLTNTALGPGFLICGVLLLTLCLTSCAYPLTLTCWHASHLPARRQIRRALSKLDSIRVEGFIQKLSVQVQQLEQTVRRLDSYARSQTRLVVFVDGLDSCEHERMLQTLDAIQLLFCARSNSLFIIFIAADPHIIVTAVQKNMGTVFTRTDLNGHDYLKNLIQMPFYLHNTAIQRMHERFSQIRRDSFDYLRWKATKSDNIYGSLHSLAESKAGSARLRPAHSQNFYDQSISDRLIRDDYFTNVNPRSIRRIINSITISGRLMRAFDVSFNWVALGHWISLAEQWPYRLSWITDYCEHSSPPDSASLKEIYDAVKPRMPTTKSEDELLEIDRNVRNFELYVENSRDPVLTVGHLRAFLPFTSNLDPYLRKLIHDKFCVQQSGRSAEATSVSHSQNERAGDDGEIELFKDPVFRVALKKLSVVQVCSLLKKLPLSCSSAAEEYCNAFKAANISGLVLSHCNLQELKSQFRFTFGDWTLISLMIEHLRAIEPKLLSEEAGGKSADARRSRSRTMSRGRRGGVIYEQEVPSDMLELSAQANLLQQRLGHLDSAEDADGNLPDLGVSRASSIAAADNLDDASSGASLADYSVDNAANVVADSTSSVAVGAAPKRVCLKSRVERLVDAIGGTVDEANRLLLAVGDAPSSESDSDDDAQQRTIRARASAVRRPSLFAVANANSNSA